MLRAAIIIGLLLAGSRADAQTSRLWGEEGERWDPRGRLPDYSYAGYHAGRRELPNVGEVANVRDFGARGNGSHDDTRAIQRAIDRAGERGGGAVFLPRGRYRITEPLHIRHDGVVLRGAGRNDTTLFVVRSLADVRGFDLEWANGNDGFLRVGRSGAFRNAGRVVEDARRGDRWLVLNRDAREQGIRPGRFVRLMMEGPRGDRSLWDHRHNDQNGPPGGQCDDAYGELGYWIVRVVRVDGPRIELDQPLRADVRERWSPTIDLVRTTSEVGVESLGIEFERTPHRGHHLERGYNGISFALGGVVNSWIRAVRIDYADNGLDLRRSKHVTVRNLLLGGSRGTAYDGHHGVTAGIDTLIEDAEIRVNYIHEITFAERTTGTVVSGGTGVRWSLDHHGRAMIENLVTNLRTSYDWLSGGGACSPFAGARHTYWNFDRPIDPPSWGEIQTNVVGDLAGGVSERRTDRRQWFEPIRSPSPHNLYQAQLRRRLDVEDRGRFAATNVGSRRAWVEDDQSRWAITRQGEDRRYWLASTAYSGRDGGRLGQMSLARTNDLGDATIAARARTYEDLARSEGADYALVLGHQNGRTYDLALIHAERGRSGIYRVTDGERSALARVSGRLLEDARWHDVAFSRRGDTLALSFDGRVVATATARARRGRAGVGSIDDAVYFDDLALSSPDLDPGMGGGIDEEPEPVLEEGDIDDGGAWEPDVPAEDEPIVEDDPFASPPVTGADADTAAPDAGAGDDGVVIASGCVAAPARSPRGAGWALAALALGVVARRRAWR